MTRLQLITLITLLFGVGVMTAAMTLMYGWWALFGGGAAYVVLSFAITEDD